MSATVTDLFCGAGGSSLGAEAAGLELVMAANHWQTAIDVHQAHFPNAGHDCADISQADPRRYPRTDILLASPECTNHSQARGVSRRRQDAALWDAPDPAAERSRATMWDVVRFAEQMRYAAIVVENVVEATKWVLWPAWVQALTDLGYRHRVLSHNSMHHGVPQSRDRIYVVWTRAGVDVDLELEQPAWCPCCDAVRTVRQAWKNGRTVGRYGQQWIWACTTCGARCEPDTIGAETVIDWSLPCPPIGDRRTKNGKPKPLVRNTRLRILGGMVRYGWIPFVTAGAGNGFERVPGNRARPTTEPVDTQTTTLEHALAVPDAFALQTAHGGRIHDLGEPGPTLCASDDRLALVLTNRRHHTPRPAHEPITTLCAGGNHHGLVMRNNTPRGDHGQMVTPVEEPARTITTKGHQSLLIPYNRTGAARSSDEPIGTITTRDRWALVDRLEEFAADIDACGFRMFEPYEASRFMAFPDRYIPRDLPKKDQVKLAGNAVCPPNMQWIAGRILQALEVAA